MDTLHRPFKQWTVEQYEALADTGAFQPDERVELIEGMIVTVPPMNAAHAGAIRKGNRILMQAYGVTHDVGVQIPVNVGSRSQPEPDFSLTALTRSEPGHPRSADLVIEVSDSSLDYDRMVKARVYAQGNFPEYWIMNLQDRLIEVHRDPVKTAKGWQYRTRFIVQPGEQLAALFAPSVMVNVADLL